LHPQRLLNSLALTRYRGPAHECRPHPASVNARWPWPPRVAVITLQWSHADETAACLRSLATLDYENYTVLFVDNHSVDGSVRQRHQRFPASTL